MWIFKRMGSSSGQTHRTKKEVLDQLALKREILKTVRTRQVRHFGHVKRHNSLVEDPARGQDRRGENKTET